MLPLYTVLLPLAILSDSYFHLMFVIYLCLGLYYKFKCNFKLILLSSEDGRWATETCLVNLISNVSSFL